jgi:hypothetical protein
VGKGWLLVGLAVGIVATASMFRDPAAPHGPTPRIVPPTESGPGEAGVEGFSERRREWYESLHRAAPGTDWRALDAAHREARLARLQAEHAQALAAGASPRSFNTVQATAVAGTWAERGSSNQSGRVTATVLDPANARLTVLSHGGNIWRSPRATPSWTIASNAATFVPNGSQGYLERLTAAGGGERLLVVGDSPATLQYSDNGGATWNASAGAGFANPWYAMGLVARDPAASEVYFIRVHFDFTAPADWRAQLFSSGDRGASFTARGFVGPRSQAALFSPRQGTGADVVFLLSGMTLNTITTGTHALVARSTLPALSPPLGANDSVALTGGASAGGQTFLYAFYSRGALNRTDVYFSGDGGLTWAARTPVPERLFSLTSAESSNIDPNRVFAGGVDAYRSADGALTWTKINPWTEYYAAPATKLHADIPNIDLFVDGAVERMYIATDGGVYESNDYGVTVNNISLSGLNVSQYYDSYTRRSAPHHIVAGSQDQGYQKALSPASGLLQFGQVISGDYAHLVSADGGQTLWSVYPTFVMYDTNTATATQSSLRFFNFGTQVTGTKFLPPLAHVPGQANVALLAGGRFGPGTPANTIIEVTYNAAGGNFTVVNDGADFVDPVTAIAVSPHAGNTRYAMAAPTNAANPGTRFYRRPVGGSWTQTATSLPNGQFFYGNDILPDPAVPGRVYIAGSGYSGGNSVFVSNDDGLTFQSMSAGLPATLVYNLASSADGQHLFAAAATGAFYYDRAQNTWIDLVTLGAPNQIYWDVDYVDTLNTARFATYGRGLWDFVLAQPGALFSNGFEP